MPTARARARAAQPEPDDTDTDTDDAAPPFWIADVPLPVAGEMGGHAMIRAFNPGDQVPAEHVERYGWAGFVHAPEGDWPPPAPASQDAAPAAGEPADDPGSGTAADDPKE